MVVFVHRRAPCPEWSVLTDDVLADLELAWEAEILNVAVRLGRVQAEQGVVPLSSLVGALREMSDGDKLSVRSRELPDDPTVDDLVGHRSKKGRSTVALPRLHRFMLARRAARFLRLPRIPGAPRAAPTASQRSSSPERDEQP
jgi:hypothetical protein